MLGMTVVPMILRDIVFYGNGLGATLLWGKFACDAFEGGDLG